MSSVFSSAPAPLAKQEGKKDGLYIAEEERGARETPVFDGRYILLSKAPLFNDELSSLLQSDSNRMVGEVLKGVYKVGVKKRSEGDGGCVKSFSFVFCS